ncbi:MAG: class I SAM-dependent methyltransferase [Alphaproteobacteria bacterium]|nr:class I SAM-dependent methyltransferase [Alphaproteobacteria bacterium]
MVRQSAAEDWRVYYQRTGDRPPRETLLDALARFEAEGAVGQAVDLGCGGGRDTIEMLRRDWSVLAIDGQASAIETLLARPELIEFGVEPETQVARFEQARWPAADLVNSSFALPLCPKADFLAMWRHIYDSLRPGGRFSGQLYGDRDQWFGDTSNSHFTLREVQDLLRAYEVELFREEETDSVTPRGTAKHWHIYHIVARKPAQS